MNTSKATTLLAMVSFVLILIIACVGVFWGVLHSKEIGRLAPQPVNFVSMAGQRAPNFVFHDGTKVYTSSTIPKPALIEFFATWCEHCQHEQVTLNRLHALYGHKLAFVGITTGLRQTPSDPRESKSDLGVYVEQYKVPYPARFDDTRTAFRAFHVIGFPRIVIIGKNGRITYDMMGESSMSDLQPPIQASM